MKKERALKRNLLVLVLILFVSSVCADTVFRKKKSQKRRVLRMPAKLDEPRKAGKTSEGVLTEPVELIRLGNTSGPAAKKGAEQEIFNFSGERYQVVKTFEVSPTGYYSAERNQKRYAFGSFEADLAMNGSGKITASGKPPEAGKTVSVDERIIPLGSKLLIEGYPGVFEAQDTGKKIRTKKRIKKDGKILICPRIDIYFGRGEQALFRALKVDNQSPIAVRILAKVNG